MTFVRLSYIAVLSLCLSSLSAQTSALDRPRNLTLSELSRSFQTLARRVTPSVVKVVAVGYRILEEGESEEPGLASRQQSSGSGVIIEPNGLIVTNAHVVMAAQRVRVTLPAPLPSNSPNRSVLKSNSRTVSAKVVGLDLETDIALLRVEETGLAALPLADSESVEQGQVVLAFGSPLGLDNSVSMGVVSSTARQFRADDPMIYIQTDAPINPGSSGGPLVDAEGNVVGINTLILSQSGGSEGLGFAVPSNLVTSVIEQIKRHGRVIRGEIGVKVQTVTPTLAAGWKLAQNWGVVVADIEPESGAEQAGLQIGDLIISLNGKTMENARQFNVNLYRPAAGDTVRLEVERNRQRLFVPVKVTERPGEAERLSNLSTLEENLVSELGVFAVDMTGKLRDQFSAIRQQDGVLVTSRYSEGPVLEEQFRAGDIIYAVNRIPTPNLKELRRILKTLKTGDPVALQIERQGRLQFLAFELP